LAPWIPLLFLAAAAQTVKVDQFPLRSGCEESDTVIARLHAGDPVQIRFSMAGASQPCYVVSATVDGKVVQGNLPADALTGLEEFDRSRRAAAPVVAPLAAPQAAAIPLPPVKSTSPEMDRAVLLLDRNQPDQALEILQKFLHLFPKDPQLLALAGTAAYKGDHLRQALDFWKESLDINPDPLVERTYKAALRESQNDKSAEKKFGTRFLLRYDGAVADSDAAGAMVATLEQEFSRISSQLGCRAEERIVTIVQSREAYLKSTGAPGWSGAGYDGRIHIPVSDQKQPIDRTRQIFAHELVHACLANIGAWPAWLHEGLAQRLAGEAVQPGTREAMKALVEELKLPKLAGFGRTCGNKSPADARVAYGVALVVEELFFQ